MNPRIALIVTSCVLSVALGFVIAQSGSREGPEVETDGILVGFSMDTLAEERWQTDRDLFVAQAGELGAEVLVQSANSDDVRQIQDIESLISRGVDVLVIVPHNAEAMARGVELAHAAGIPVLSYDRLIRDSDVDLYISFDNYRVGELQAEYLVDRLPGGRGRIVRIYGAPTDNNASQFKEGQDRVILPLVERGAIEVVHEDWTEGWRPENAKRITQAAINQHGTDFDAILASNDGTAGGAVQALMEEGVAGEIIVTGQDAELSACQRIVAGTQAMTIYKPIHVLARAAAEAAVALARGEPVIASQGVDNGHSEIPTIFLEVHVVTPDNLQETVIADGFHTEQEVFRGATE